MLFFAIFFAIAGIVFILFGEILSNSINSFSEKSIKESAKYLGNQSVPRHSDMKISAPFFRLIGVIILISAMIGIFFIYILQKGS